MIARTLEIFLVFFRLGLTSFGGPVAHLSFFHQEFVARKKWVDEHSYADLVAFCQFLPGPASSQVGIALGLSRGGVPGALAAWLGFTLPSAIVMTLFALGLNTFDIDVHSGWLHGLKVAAAAVVAQAVWAMGVRLCPDKRRISIAVGAAITVSLLFSVWTQLLVIAGGGAIGLLLFASDDRLPKKPMEAKISRRLSLVTLVTFFSMLLILPLFTYSAPQMRVFDSFFRVGSLVFGGGHVVLPLLQSEVVPAGWVSKSTFLAGYGAAQAMPGPLFSFAAFLGAVMTAPVSGPTGATLCLIAIYLPSFLLILGLLPLWERVRKHQKMRDAMLGVNAAVVGLLLAALYNPIWTNSILSTRDFCLVLAAFTLLKFWKLPSWLIVLLSALVGQFLAGPHTC